MPETVGVGLIGLGTVGSAVAARLMSDWELLADRAGRMPVLRRVAVRDVRKPRDVDLRSVPLVDDPATVVDDPAVAVVVEVMGGTGVAAVLAERALSQGKVVVTANKALIAGSGPQLAEVAAAHGTGIWFEAAVGAGLPVIALLRDSLGGDRIEALDAVINGTTNVILTRMRRDGIGLATALRAAQRAGFAEADPSSDIDGWDAAHKLVIMSWLAFGAHVPVESVDRQGIGAIAREDLAYTGQLGYTVKLVAHAERSTSGRVHLRVRPALVPEGHDLHDVDDDANAVIISSDLARTVRLSGVGAGGASTASAVVSDVVAAVRARGAAPPLPRAQRAPLLGDDDVEVAGYVRLRVEDSPEARALVVQALEDRGVPVVETVDKPPLDGPHPQLLVVTGTAPRAVHDRALETLDTLAPVREIACAMDRLESPG